MLVRNEIIYKWLLYGLAAALCLFVQTALLQRLTFWGVIPFLYPLLAAIPPTWESPTAGTIFALSVGVVCDLLLPGPLPCFYTLVFPFVGMFASLLAQGVLRAGFLCSLAAGALAFLLTDTFHCLLLWLSGKAAWEAGAFLALREFAVAAPLCFPMTILFRAVFRRTHIND